MRNMPICLAFKSREIAYCKDKDLRSFSEDKKR